MSLASSPMLGYAVLCLCLNLILAWQGREQRMLEQEAALQQQQVEELRKQAMERQAAEKRAATEAARARKPVSQAFDSHKP